MLTCKVTHCVCKNVHSKYKIARCMCNSTMWLLDCVLTRRVISNIWSYYDYLHLDLNPDHKICFPIRYHAAIQTTGLHIYRNLQNYCMSCDLLITRNDIRVQVRVQFKFKFKK